MLYAVLPVFYKTVMFFHAPLIIQGGTYRKMEIAILNAEVVIYGMSEISILTQTGT